MFVKAAGTDDANKVDKKRQDTGNAEKPQPNKFHKGSKAKGKGKSKKRKPVPSGRKGMHSRTAKGDQICYGYNLGTCKQGSACPRKHVCMFVLCQGATKIIFRRSINDSVLKVFHPIQRQNGRSNMWIMNLPRTRRTLNLILGRAVISALHYFAAQVICLDLTREDHQKLVTVWRTSGKCLWMHFGESCGTAPKARLKRKKHHSPPPLRSPRWPNGLPGVCGADLARLRPCTYCFGVHCRSKRLKLSHFHSIAAGKQLSKMTSLLAVPECSYFGDERFAKWFCF